MSLAETRHTSGLLIVPPPPLESHRSPVLGYQACHHSAFSPQCLLTLLSPSEILQDLIGGRNLLSLGSH